MVGHNENQLATCNQLNIRDNKLNRSKTAHLSRAIPHGQHHARCNFQPQHVVIALSGCFECKLIGWEGNKACAALLYGDN